MNEEKADNQLSKLQAENALLREEVRVSRRASNITARLTVAQFVRIDEILKKLEEKAEAEKSLRQALSEKLREAEDRESQLARDRELLQSMQIAAINMMEDIAAARKVAEDATQAKSEFLANMSHEIRTPMTAILGFADVLLEHGAIEHAPPERIDAARTIKRNGQYLLSIINDILDLSKVEAGKMVVENIPCEPCRIIAEVASLMKVQADGKGLEFDVDFEGPIPQTIRTDPTRLRQILINLIGNSIKFTETGGVRLVTRLDLADHAEPMLQFDVIDTGLGMTPGQVSRLFQPFNQADNSTTRKFGGTGLGLTISKRFAQMLGGDIDLVETRRDFGSRFRVTTAVGSLAGVPMIHDPRTAAVLADAAEQPELLDHEPYALKDRRLLLAEDGPDNQRLIAYVLEKEGACVVVKGNGRLAVDAALAADRDGKPFDAVLMDMQMPVMDGYQATRELRNHGYAGPVVALTAHAMASDRQKCLDAGCDDYATKPVDRKTLIAKLKKVIASARSVADASRDHA